MCGGYLIKSDGWTHGSLDAANLHTEVAQHLHNTVFVGVLLFHVDIWLTVVVVVLQQVESGVAVVFEVEFGVVGLHLLVAHCHERFTACLGLCFHLFHVELYVALLFWCDVHFGSLGCDGLGRSVIRFLLFAFGDVEFHRLLFGVVKHLGVGFGGDNIHICHILMLASAHLEFHLIK